MKESHAVARIQVWGYTLYMNIFLDLLFWGITFGVIGKVLLGYTVIKVHSKIVQEHMVDGAVLSEMAKERNIAILGIVFIIIGYLFEVRFYEYF